MYLDGFSNFFVQKYFAYSCGEKKNTFHLHFVKKYSF